jgi:nicotinamide mononucleotide transporter
LSLLEVAAAGFGLAAVVLTIRQSLWCWPAGLVQVTLYIFVFHSARLYSDMILHVVYVALQIYGWHHWLHGGQARQAPPVSRLSPSQLALWSFAAIAAAIAWGEAMERYTDAALPHLDAFIATASLCAQYLLARKKLESWLFWIVVDAIAIGVYWSRGLEPTAALYAVFLCLCFFGLAAWRRSFAFT